jgi:hypothetical protein
LRSAPLTALLAVGLLLACAQEANVPVAEVRAARDCPEPRCISREQATRELGFAPWEPTELPEGFEIFGRAVRSPRIGESPPGTEPQLSLPGQAPPTLTTAQQPRTLYLEYRFNESLNVAGIVVTESVHTSPGTDIRLQVRDQACGEVINAGQERLVYVHGFAVAEPGAGGEWWICKVPEEPPRNSHTVMLTRGEVLIEVVAFPEAGVSKEDILRLAQSFVEAE